MRRKFMLFVCVICTVFALMITVYGIHINDPLYYNGPYVDLIAQERVSAPSPTGLTVVTVDTKTGYALGTTMSTRYGPFLLLERKICIVDFMFEEKPMKLRFENNKLTGCRHYSTNMTLDEQLQTANQWETDPEVLRAVLSDYAAQVNALL